MPQLSDLRPGDVLVQCKGEPWRTGAAVFTGHPFPHSMLVTYNGYDGTYIIEDGPNGVQEVEFGREWNGLTSFPLDHYEVWRPRCDNEIKESAIKWARLHAKESYNYLGLISILLFYRIYKNKTFVGMDDDVSQDNRKKWCSELIAMSYYRSDYDLVPLVVDHATMPWDLRNLETCDLIF